MSKILIIDDDVLVGRSLSRLFSDMGHEVLLADSLTEGRRLAEAALDVIYLDLDLPDGDGLAALDVLAAGAGRPEIIVITGMGAGYGAEKSLSGSVWDYIAKPASPKVFRESLESVLAYRAQAGDGAEAGAAPPFDPCGVLGEDPATLRLLDELARAAASDAGLLLCGETGVGKELAAGAVHANSRRRNKPFVVVDCSNLTETLVESRLYGHRKGAFTGAHVDRAGLVEQADGGTLFLDEIGELPLGLQASFLRVLQERRFRPLGAGAEKKSDFRLIAATNRNLAAMVREGNFRSDLLFRLRTVEVVLPPLRERGGDGRLLAERFAAHCCDRCGTAPKRVSDEFLRVVDGYDWPGNVRELANVMEAAVISAGADPVLYPKHLPANVRISFLGARDGGGRGEAGPAVASSARPRALATYAEHKAVRDRDYFMRLLETADYNIATAAQISGLSVPSVYRHLSLAGLSTKRKQAGS